MANLKAPLRIVRVCVVNKNVLLPNGPRWADSEKFLAKFFKFTLSRGHFYIKMKYLQTETTEQGPFLGKLGTCQLAQNGPMLLR